MEKGEVLEERLKKSREAVTEPEQEGGLLSVELLDSAAAPSVGSPSWFDSQVVANSKAVETQIEAGTRSSYRI